MGSASRLKAAGRFSRLVRAKYVTLGKQFIGRLPV